MNRNYALFSLLFLILFAACGDGPPSGTTVEGKKVFRYNQPNTITSLDPAFAKSQNNIWAVDHLFNGLIQLDEQLNIQPAIAKSWTISEDGTTYTFTLRDDVFFHDSDAFADGKGRKVIASDFVYSFNRIIDQSISSPGSWLLKGNVRSKDPFEAIDDQTFLVHLTKAFRPMLGILTMQYCSVVPKEAIEKFGKEFRSKPVGTGPFQFKTWLENQALVLIKNENYFEDGLPILDGIKITFIADRKTAYLELMNDKLDFMSGLESSFVNELLTTEGTIQDKVKDKLDFYKSPYLNFEYLGINLKSDTPNNPLLKKEVRQALNYAFDRKLMLKTLRNNVGKPAISGVTPAGLPSFAPDQVKGYTYDPDKATTLLKAAGYPNGEGFPEIAITTNKDYMDICTFIKRQWEDIGIKSKIDLVESATLRQMMTKGQTDLFRASWIADYPDAENYFTLFYSKNPAPPNYTQFVNPAFDAMYEQALKENDDNKRYELYHQMDKIIIEEAPVVFLYYDETALFANNRVSGLSKNAINLLSLKRVSK